MVRKSLDSRLLRSRIQSCRQLHTYMHIICELLLYFGFLCIIYRSYRGRMLSATLIVVAIKRQAFSIPLRKAMAYLGR